MYTYVKIFINTHIRKQKYEIFKSTHTNAYYKIPYTHIYPRT